LRIFQEVLTDSGFLKKLNILKGIFRSPLKNEQTHAATGGGTHLTQLLDGVGLAVVLRHHRQAGGAAIHGIGLEEVGEGAGHKRKRCFSYGYL
jgi:hypothetical protein